MTMAESVRRMDNASGPVPDLAELCRIHDVGLELIACSDDLDTLPDRVLEEYERRLAELPREALDPRAEGSGEEAQRKLRALVMFATQASALRAKAVAADELRRRAEAVEAESARLNGVLAALHTGVLIVSAAGVVRRANGAAAALLEVEGLVTFHPLEGLQKLKSGSDEVSFSTVSCSPSVLLDRRVGNLARQAKSPDGGLKIPAVCPDGHGKGFSWESLNWDSRVLGLVAHRFFDEFGDVVDFTESSLFLALRPSSSIRQ